ncbi:hypothetical protein R1flu_018250 [Riccia fluitans]|uniref:Uncharacterized protein n=1 Tax=Riccia fluitans TaxID=41844 RepID=A0ABD1ZGB0_9MARC
MRDVCKQQKYATKKMTEKPDGGLIGQSGSRASDQILSGWQGSDEDEDVNIDNSDDEEVGLPPPKRNSTSSTSSLLGVSSEEKSRERDTETPFFKRGKPSSRRGIEKSGPAPVDRSAMKVRSADARRFRKEFTTNKSGAKPASIPQAPSASPSINGIPGSGKNDGRRFVRSEDFEEGDILPGESTRKRNDFHGDKVDNGKSVGTPNKRDEGESKSVEETRKRKEKDSTDSSDSDDEARKRRRYRELEKAQRIADRRLTLRERPDPRQQDGRAPRREATNHSVESVQRKFGERIPRQTNSVVRLRNGNEILPVGLQMEDKFGKEDLKRQMNKKLKTPEKVAEFPEAGRNPTQIPENSAGKDSPSKPTSDPGRPEELAGKGSLSKPTPDPGRNATRSPEKLAGKDSPPKPTPDSGSKPTRYPEKLAGKDSPAKPNRDPGRESTRSPEKSPGKDSPAKPPVGVHEGPSNNLGNKKGCLVLSGTRTGENAEDFPSHVSTERLALKRAEPPTTNGSSASGVLEDKKKTTIDSDIRSIEVLVKANDTALHENVNYLKPCGEEAVTNEDEQDSSLKGSLSSHKKVTKSCEADFPDSEAGGLPKIAGKATTWHITKSSGNFKERKVSESEEGSSRTKSQVSGDIVEGRGTRCRHTGGEDAVDRSERATGITATVVAPVTNKTHPIRDSSMKLRADTIGSGLEKRLDSFTGKKEGVVVGSPESAGDTNLSNNGIEKCCDTPGCKVTYHLECADPSMTEVPEGKWYCPSCAQKRLSYGVSASLQAVESIWDVRDCTCPSCNSSKHDGRTSDNGKASGMVEESGDPVRLRDLPVNRKRLPERVDDSSRSSSGTSQRVTRRKQVEQEAQKESEKQKPDAALSSSCLVSPSAEGQSKRCDKEYFVKWKNLSHLHNTWVTESELKKAAPKTLDSFRKRLETEGLNQGRNKWKAIWQVPERFLAKKLNGPPRRPGGGRGRGYLGMDARLEWFVKWQDLGHEHCTWESVHAGLLDIDLCKVLESNYDRWCEDAKRRSLPAHLEEVMRLRGAKFKALDEQPEWLQGCRLSDQQMHRFNTLRKRWHHHHNSLMVDERDQERTTTAVAFLLSLVEEFGAFKPVLVIVPATGLQMWKSELRRCAEHVNTVVYAGVPMGRSIIQRYELNPSEKPVKVQIALTTFEIANSDHEYLRKFEWEALILDEGHRARLSKSYRQLQFRAPYRLILLSDYSKCTPWELQQFLVFLEPENTTLESELQKHLERLDEDSQLVFLRGKLSEKMVGDGGSSQRTPLEFKEHWIEGIMTPIQVHLYCTELIKHFHLLHNGRTRADQNMGSIYELTGTLRNVCNHPFLVDSTLQEDLLSMLKPPQTLVEAGVRQCGKFKMLQRMLTYLHAEGRRVLLVCQTDMLCYYFDDYMRQIFGADSYECVSKGSEAVKIQAIQRFNAEDSTRFVFILKRNTAGVSFQLRETDAVIVYDSDWNPANDLQYLQKIIYKGRLNLYRLYTSMSVEEAAITYYSERRSDLHSGSKVWSAKYCQQIIKWKVKELFELNDVHSRGASEKDLMAKVLNRSSDDSLENIVKRILDGEVEPGIESFEGEIPEEEVEALKEFWASLLRERYAALQMEEQTNARKGLRNRKRVHYSEDALALASYTAANNEEEVKKKRRKTHGIESAQQGVRTVNTSHPSPKFSPVTGADSCSTEESLPAKSVSKDTNSPYVVSQPAVEEVSPVIPEKATRDVELRSGVEENETESQIRISEREEIVQPDGPRKISAKTTSGLSSASHEEGRKTRCEQQQVLLGLWRPEVTRICKTLQLSEKAATYADQLLVHCMKSYRMPKEPKDLVLQVQLALCVVAAERFHQKKDHAMTLSKIESFMDVKLKKESWEENFGKISVLCKGYPLPELPEEKLISQGQSVDVVSDVAGKVKPTDEDTSQHKPVVSGAVLENCQSSHVEDKRTSCQTPEPCEDGNSVDHGEAHSGESVQLPETAASNNHPDERQAAGKELEPHTGVERDAQREREQRLKPVAERQLASHGQKLVTADERLAAQKTQDVVTQAPDVRLPLAPEVKDVSGNKGPDAQVAFDGPLINEGLQNPPPTFNKGQILEKLKVERHEINKIVVHQQTKEMNDFYRLNHVEKDRIQRRHQETVAKLLKALTDSNQRATILEGQGNTYKENVKKFDMHTKEKHEILVKRQRAIRDEIHAVYAELLRQASGGSTRSLYDEAQAILANMGVKSVEEAQNILRAVEDEVRRKKAPAVAPQGPVGRVRSQTGRIPSDSQAPNILESTRLTQRVSLPPSASVTGAESRVQSSHIAQTPPVVSQPSIRSGTPSAQPPVSRAQSSPMPQTSPLVSPQPSVRSGTPSTQPPVSRAQSSPMSQTSPLVSPQPSVRSGTPSTQPPVSRAQTSLMPQTSPLVSSQPSVRSGTPPTQPPVSRAQSSRMPQTSPLDSPQTSVRSGTPPAQPPVSRAQSYLMPQTTPTVSPQPTIRSGTPPVPPPEPRADSCHLPQMFPLVSPQPSVRSGTLPAQPPESRAQSSHVPPTSPLASPQPSVRSGTPPEQPPESLSQSSQISQTTPLASPQFSVRSGTPPAQPSEPRVQSAHISQTSPLVSTQPSVRLVPPSAPPRQVSQLPPLQLQQAAPPPAATPQSNRSAQPVQPNVSTAQTNDVQHSLHQRTAMPARQASAVVQEDIQSPRQQQVLSSPNVLPADPVPSQLPPQVGRTQPLQPSATSQHQRPIQLRQLTAEQQRNLSTRRPQSTAVPQQQTAWQTSSTGQGVAAYARLHPPSQNSGNPLSGTASANVTAHVSPMPTVNNVASFTQAGVLLPAIPPNMLGPDPVLLEESRLKKEKDIIKNAHENKAMEIRKKYTEEKEDAQRKYEALLAEIKRKYEGMLDENAQYFQRQTTIIHEKHLRARYSRLVAEALRNRAMFDIVYQPRHTGQQGVELGSSSGQVQNGAGHACPPTRSYAPPTQQTTLAMQHIAAVNGSMINTGSGQSGNASLPAGRAHFSNNSSVHARVLGSSQTEVSARSSSGQVSTGAAVPRTFASGGVATQHTNGNNLVPTEGVQGQRNDFVYGVAQQGNSLSTAHRPSVPSGISRVAVVQSTNSPHAPTYVGSPSIVSASAGMGAAVGASVQSAGLGHELGGASVGGLWQGRAWPGAWRNGVSLTHPSGTVDSQTVHVTVPASWIRTSAGSPALSASNSRLGGSAQPAGDNSQGQQWTSTLNRVNVNMNPTSSQQRRSWASEWAGNILMPEPYGNPVLHSDTSVSGGLNGAAVERLRTIEAAVASYVPPASGPVYQPECVVNRAQDVDWRSVPSPHSSQHPSLSVRTSGEPQIGGDGLIAAGLFEVLEISGTEGARYLRDVEHYPDYVSLGNEVSRQVSTDFNPAAVLLRLLNMESILDYPSFFSGGDVATSFA